MKGGRADDARGAPDFPLPIGTVMTIFGFIVGLAILHVFGHYVDGLLRMAETLRLMLGANRNFRVALEGPPEVQQLARAANDLAQQRNELLDDVDAQIARPRLRWKRRRIASPPSCRSSPRRW